MNSGGRLLNFATGINVQPSHTTPVGQQGFP
jgi:hypothetical protein